MPITTSQAMKLALWINTLNWISTAKICWLLACNIAYHATRKCAYFIQILVGIKSDTCILIFCQFGLLAINLRCAINGVSNPGLLVCIVRCLTQKAIGWRHTTRNIANCRDIDNRDKREHPDRHSNDNIIQNILLGNDKKTQAYKYTLTLTRWFERDDSEVVQHPLPLSYIAADLVDVVAVQGNIINILG